MVAGAGKEVTFTPELIDRLQKAYDKAKAEDRDTFQLAGNTYVTNYAKYLLEFLNSR